MYRLIDRMIYQTIDMKMDRLCSFAKIHFFSESIQGTKLARPCRILEHTRTQSQKKHARINVSCTTVEAMVNESQIDVFVSSVCSCIWRFHGTSVDKECIIC